MFDRTGPYDSPTDRCAKATVAQEVSRGFAQRSGDANACQTMRLHRRDRPLRRICALAQRSPTVGKARQSGRVSETSLGRCPSQRVRGFLPFSRTRKVAQGSPASISSFWPLWLHRQVARQSFRGIRPPPPNRAPRISVIYCGGIPSGLPRP